MIANIVDIPTALVMGLVDDKDLRILSIEQDIIMLESDEVVDFNDDLRMVVYDVATGNYEELPIEHYKCISSEKKQFSYIYTLRIDAENANVNTTYIEKLRELLSKINAIKIIREKGGDDLTTLKDMSKNLKQDIDKSYKIQKENWYNIDTALSNQSEFAKISRDIELAFSVDTLKLYNKCNQDGITKTIAAHLKDVGLMDHGLFNKAFTRLYIGNAFCHNLLPGIGVLDKLFKKAIEEHYHITVVMPYVRENTVDDVLETLKWMNDFVRNHEMKIEVVINDWGVMNIMKENYPMLISVLGTLLNKREKDPRYLTNCEITHIRKKQKENYLNHNFFMDFLQEKGITRFECEAYGSMYTVPKGHHSLHFPLYQLNTSEYCPLHAECTNLSRFKQELVEKCPKYCEDYVYLYPKYLNMIGKGNSILGFNSEVLEQPSVLKKYFESGIDRLVYTSI